MTPLLQVEGLVKRFGPLAAVDGVGFEMARGETLALVGESGCGKTTVARLLLGLQSADAGRIVFDGVALTGRAGAAGRRAVRRRMQMVFQDPYSSLNPRWRVSDIVAEPLREQRLAASKAEAAGRAAALLHEVGLDADAGRRYPHQFSGGQRQRIAIARALASRPDWVACDEPTSSLDVSVQAQVLNLMRDLQRERGMAYLFISHNLAVVRHMADRVAVMVRGRIVELAPRERVFAAPRHPYTRLLIDAVPRVHGAPRAAALPVRDAEAAASWAQRCAFAPRCPHANERCRRETPRELSLAGVRIACHAVEEGRL